MTAGTGILAGILLVFGLLYGMQWLMARKAKALEGQEAPELLRERGLAGDGLLWFHSPTCGPCRAMKPHVEGLVAQGKARIVDVSITPEVALACGVLGTPTTVAICGGRIVEVAPGVVPPAGLQKMLERCAA